MGGAKGAYSVKSWKNPGEHSVSGHFTTDGANAPTAISGKGFSVSAPTSGVYTITLADGPFADAYDVFVHLETRTTNSNDYAELRSLANLATAGTFTIATQSAAGTDANLTGPIVHFRMNLRNTART